jgi:signal transduction histidine kinase
VQRFAGRIAREADRLARLVRELIDLSRLQGGEPLPDLVPVQVDDVIAEAVDRTRTAARAKDLQIAVGGQVGLVVRGAESQLVTAVTNLLANAVAYSTGETRIAVAARARSGFAEIAVTDSGIGIPRKDRQRVFERFYRVDQSRASSTGGTGLGLAIVKHVATNHGGSVTVWSEEGLGSTFTLRIPLMATLHDATLQDVRLQDRATDTAPGQGDSVATDEVATDDVAVDAAKDRS